MPKELPSTTGIDKSFVLDMTDLNILHSIRLGQYSLLQYPDMYERLDKLNHNDYIDFAAKTALRVTKKGENALKLAGHVYQVKHKLHGEFADLVVIDDIDTPMYELHYYMPELGDPRAGRSMLIRNLSELEMQVISDLRSLKPGQKLSIRLADSETTSAPQP